MRGRVIYSLQTSKRTSTVFSCKGKRTLNARNFCARSPSRGFQTVSTATYSCTDLSQMAALLHYLPQSQAASAVTSSQYSDHFEDSRLALNGFMSCSKGLVVVRLLSTAKGWCAALLRFDLLYSRGGPFFSNGRATCFASGSTL